MRALFCLLPVAICLAGCGEPQVAMSLNSFEVAYADEDTSARASSPWGEAMRMRYRELPGPDQAALELMAETGAGTIAPPAGSATAGFAQSLRDAHWMASESAEGGPVVYTLSPRGAIGLPKLIVEALGEMG